jgi:hypothetical protein
MRTTREMLFFVGIQYRNLTGIELVARIERSEIRGHNLQHTPDFAALYPGYIGFTGGSHPPAG